MPFVEDSEYEKQEKTEEIRERVLKKKEDMKVKTMFEGGDKKKAPKISFKDIQRAMGHEKKQEDKPPTLKEMQNNFKINTLIEEKTKEEINALLKKGEMREIKDEAVGLLALPQTHPIKRYILHNKLKDSEIINEYINKNVIYRMATYANDTVKFGVVYALKFIQTEADYKRYEMQQLAQKQQQEQQQQSPQQQPQATTQAEETDTESREE